jgi:hypothetical protein
VAREGERGLVVQRDAVPWNGGGMEWSGGGRRVFRPFGSVQRGGVEWRAAEEERSLGRGGDWNPVESSEGEVVFESAVGECCEGQGENLAARCGSVRCRGMG